MQIASQPTVHYAGEYREQRVGRSFASHPRLGLPREILDRRFLYSTRKV